MPRNPFKSKYFSFTMVNGRKYEVRLKHNDTLVGYVYIQAGNDSYRYSLVGRIGHQSAEYNEKGIVRRFTIEVLSEDYL